MIRRIAEGTPRDGALACLQGPFLTQQGTSSAELPFATDEKKLANSFAFLRLRPMDFSGKDQVRLEVL